MAKTTKQREIRPGDKVIAMAALSSTREVPTEGMVLYVHPRWRWCTVETKRGIRFSPWTEDVQKVG